MRKYFFANSSSCGFAACQNDKLSDKTDSTISNCSSSKLTYETSSVSVEIQTSLTAFGRLTLKYSRSPRVIPLTDSVTAFPYTLYVLIRIVKFIAYSVAGFEYIWHSRRKAVHTSPEGEYIMGSTKYQHQVLSYLVWKTI